MKNADACASDTVPSATAEFPVIRKHQQTLGDNLHPGAEPGGQHADPQGAVVTDDEAPGKSPLRAR